ncbi:unnamed protein product [Effrenium voratum]|uniref:Uncharacterized protein n=1 Tax=Effrenium voratum TaxID=2562239 RepID=A0AA36NJI7_9DINO|nr:unnamed protein product [Effrenium voratum]CAJ1427821.1 unnamed protein product [Effrenium voratum]
MAHDMDSLMKSPGLTDLELSPPTLLASLSPKSSKRAAGKIRSASISDSCEPFSGKEELPDIQEKEAAPELTKTDALALQRALLAAFEEPSFQRRLRELAEEHRVSQGKTRGYTAGFMRLVRREQMKVLPDFGFEASEHGVEAMLRAFAEWKGDCDIQVQEKIIQDTLRSAEPKNEADHVEAPARTRPANKFDIANMLHELQIAFSEPWFQDEIHELRVSADYRAGRRNPEPGALPTLDEHAVDPEGYYNLSGRAALALQGHKHILPRYCFEGTPEGVRKMLLHVSTYLGDKDVDRAFDAVNCKLGMEPNARLRFRQLVASASAQSLDLEALHCTPSRASNSPSPRRQP